MGRGIFLLKAILYLSLGLVCAAQVAAAAGQLADEGPVRLILDTDIGGDVDDALALAVIHALESRGECSLLAVTVTKDHPLAAAFVDAVNRFYGRGDIPVGLVVDGVMPEASKFLPLAAVKDGAKLRYPNRYAGGERAPDAVGVLRQVLAAQPDQSVVIVQVGFSTNLASLLDSVPDSFSTLHGRDLVSQKVRRLLVMAGYFEATSTPDKSRHKEYNVVQDIASAQKLVDQWPTSIDFSGFEIGRDIEYPAVSIQQDFGYVVHHPVAEAYELYMPPPHNRPTWDLTSVLQAVRPTRGYFGLSLPGRVSIDNEGVSHFEEDEKGLHRYFTVTPQQILRAKEAFTYLSSQPPCDTVQNK